MAQHRCTLPRVRVCREVPQPPANTPSSGPIMMTAPKPADVKHRSAWARVLGKAVCHPTCFTQTPRTSGSMALVSVEARAMSRSYIRWRFSQNSGLVPRARPILNAVSAVIDLRQLTMSLIRIGGTPIVLARRYWLMPTSSRNPARYSPGWMGVDAVTCFLLRLRQPTRLPRPTAPQT